MIYQVAGALRPGADGQWFVLDDAAHAPIGGLEVAAVTASSITVTFDPASKIHSFVVGVDDVLGKLHYTAGASVGLDRAVIFLANDNGQIDPRLIANPSANLWVFGVLST